MSHQTVSRKTPIAPSIPEQQVTAAIPSFDTLPNSAFIRESQLVQDHKRPDSTAPLPFSASTLWRMVKAGTFPAPVKLSPRVTAWKCGAVREWMTAQSAK